MSQGSIACACVGPWPLAPAVAFTTIGAFNWPPLLKRSFAAWDGSAAPVVSYRTSSVNSTCFSYSASTMQPASLTTLCSLPGGLTINVPGPTLPF